MKICILHSALQFLLSFSSPSLPSSSSSPFVLRATPCVHSLLHSSSVWGSEIFFAPSSGQIWDCPRFPVIRLVVAPGLLYGILFMRKLQNRLLEEGIDKKKRVKSTTYQRALCLSTCTAVVINATLVHHTNNTAIMICTVVELLGWALNLANLLWWSYEYKRNLDATFDSFLLSKRPNHTAPFRKKKSFLQQFKHQITGRKLSMVTLELSPVKHEKQTVDKKLINLRQKLAMNMMLGISASLTCLLAYVVSSNPLWGRDAADEGERLIKCSRRFVYSTLLIARSFIFLLGAAALNMAWIQTIIMFLASRRRQNGGFFRSMRPRTRQWWNRFVLRIHPLDNGSTLSKGGPPQGEQPSGQMAGIMVSQFARSSVQGS
jgi:hypothetical protein